MRKHFAFTAFTFFVLAMVTDFILHGLLLHSDYAKIPLLMRTEADSQTYMPWLLLGHVSFSVAITWVYRQGLGHKPWLKQGLRFGVAVACLTAVPTYFIYYSVQPLPGLLVMKQVVFDFVRTVGLGAFLGWMHR